jgi:hypothetical protein
MSCMDFEERDPHFNIKDMAEWASGKVYGYVRQGSDYRPKTFDEIVQLAVRKWPYYIPSVLIDARKISGLMVLARAKGQLGVKYPNHDYLVDFRLWSFHIVEGVTLAIVYYDEGDTRYEFLLTFVHCDFRKDYLGHGCWMTFMASYDTSQEVLKLGHIVEPKSQPAGA